MTEGNVLRKDQLEISLVKEKKLIKEGNLKDDNPLDLSEPFAELCGACRKGDLKVCQEKITEGVNINARDPYDYTPLILVSQNSGDTTLVCPNVGTGKSLWPLRGGPVAPGVRRTV